MREKLTKAKKAGKPEANGKKQAAPVDSDDEEEDSDEDGLDAVSCTFLCPGKILNKLLHYSLIYKATTTMKKALTKKRKMIQVRYR